MLIALGFAGPSLLLQPRGSRRLRLPYFFLGAAFFLLETSNVVRLSLLYGSTWYVNVLVFSGILVLVLAGNLSAAALKGDPFDLLLLLLGASVALAYAVPTAALLAMPWPPLRAAASVVVFLAPVYFASVIFACLIRDEKHLDQAYGSNVLGAVVGGVSEYLSLLFGFKFLLAVTLGFYLVAYLLLRAERRRPALA
jgi:hypothetical protein